MVAHAHLDRAAKLNDAMRVSPGQLEAICRKYRVGTLRLFGSALTERFSDESSDIDLAVEFDERLDLPWYGQVTGLIDELSGLFGRSVDVVDQQAVRNPYLRENIAARGVMIYGESQPKPSGAVGMMDEAQERTNRIRGVLSDIIECCDQLMAFTDQKTLDDFLGDKMLQLATERLFITIGEAANGLRKADPDAEHSISSLGEIVAMRNRLVHQYWTADQKLLWDVVGKHVPVLREQTGRYLETINP